MVSSARANTFAARGSTFTPPDADVPTPSSPQDRPVIPAKMTIAISARIAIDPGRPRLIPAEPHLHCVTFNNILISTPSISIYPMGMMIPGRANPKAFSCKRLCFGKTGKLNRDEYTIGRIASGFTALPPQIIPIGYTLKPQPLLRRLAPIFQEPAFSVPGSD